MRTIYKYPLRITNKQTISIPKFSELLSIQMQNSDLFMWALVTPNTKEEDRHFEIYGTGHPITDRIDRKYITTVQTESGKLVWHIFESEK